MVSKRYGLNRGGVTTESQVPEGNLAKFFFRHEQGNRCHGCCKVIAVLEHGHHYFCRCGWNMELHGNELTAWEGPSANFPDPDEPNLHRKELKERLENGYYENY